MLSLLSFVFFIGCSDKNDATDTAGDTAGLTDSATSGTTDTGTSETELPEPAALAELSDGECPDLTTSGVRSSFQSGGFTREVITLLPSTLGEDMPIVFVWHPLGGDAQYMVDALNLQSWADSYGAVIVVPESEPGNLLEWDFWNDETTDLTFYDDLRTCAADQLPIDLSRLSIFGFSAGALWSSKLSILRGDTLATAVISSGGCEMDLPTGTHFIDCEPPAMNFPALVAWGGANDVYGISGLNVSFEDSTLNYLDLLEENDHFTVSCDHGTGHTIPSALVTPFADWLVAHTYGAPSPYESTGISDFPSYCAIQE